TVLWVTWAEVALRATLVVDCRAALWAALRTVWEVLARRVAWAWRRVVCLPQLIAHRRSGYVRSAAAKGENCGRERNRRADARSHFAALRCRRLLLVPVQ